MIKLEDIESIRNSDDDSLSDLLENIVNGELSRLERPVVKRILEESFRRDDPDIVWNALEIVSKRRDVESTDLLVDAAHRKQEWYVAIFLIEQLLERSEDICCDIFFCFLSLENGDQVRWMASRALLIIGNVNDIAKAQMFFDAERDVLVRLNLAGLLFLVLRDQSFFSFIQKYYNDLSLEIAREARECLTLVQDHLS